jgi:hypothetical protein
MAATSFVEEESGTYTARFQHSHNGYYAGDFSQTPWSGFDQAGRPAAFALHQP